MKRNDLTFSENEEIQDLTLMKSMLYYVAKMSTNTIDSRVILFDTALTDLHEIFERSDLQTALSDKGITASINGDYFMVGSYVNDKPYFLTYEILDDNWESVGRDYTRMVVLSNKVVKSKDGFNKEGVFIYKVLDKDEMINGKIVPKGSVVKSGGYHNKGKVTEFSFSDENNTVYVYPQTIKNAIPGNRIRNAYDSAGDLEHVIPLLKMASKFLEKIPTEYEWLKTLLATNDNYGVGDSVDEVIKSIEKDGGRKVKGGELGNGQLGSQVGLFKEGGTTVDILMSLVGSINDLVFKLALISRDTDSSGTNKHGTEIALFNQAASEFIEAKIKQRQTDITYFMKKIAPLFVDKFELPDEYRIEYDLSDFEEGKRVALRESQSTIELKQAQAENYKAIAQKQIASIELEQNKFELEKESVKTAESEGTEISIRENIQ